ncbi:MmgE/PrpD family protein [Shimia sp. CNT1-13L.2]|uniref:MmgE/PrpD family protein n=1 Tax=Shimia sp. CNT1-13L.2 TaxID=2959663 RepID=UPI0020CE8D38|nr:MmgE/PrpD family protein [Shimia sp. CNT1-13L.2]MCP9481118.1 MmgE/PrpD family protein [Shimia sp. CNT1-13L.2]
MNTARALARFAIKAQPTPDLAAIAAPAVADCFGCILAGAKSDVAQRAQTALARLGQGSAPLFGIPITLTAPHAALANAVAGHAWDLDDWEEPGNTHPTVVLLPALLAAAHLHSCTGRDLLAAYAVGCEIIMRLGEALTLGHYARGFHSTATLGAIGAAGACARLLGLDETATTHAISIATSQATGYTLQFGSNAKPLQAGFAARAGLEAALFAASGMTGQPNVIDHPKGFSGLMAPREQDRFRHMASRLGSPWALQEYGLVLKPWPSCGYTHRLMTAALTLRDTLQNRLDTVTAIHAKMPDFHHAILPFHTPTNRNEALFSAPACIAQALTTGNLTLDDSAAGFWQDPQVARLVACTTVCPEPARNLALNYDPNQPDTLTVTLASGEQLSASCAYPLGAPQNPMTTHHLAAKFQAVTGHTSATFTRLLDWQVASDIQDFFTEITL